MQSYLSLGIAIGVGVLSTSAMAANNTGFGVSTSAAVNDFGRFVSVASAYRMGADSSGNYTNSVDTPPIQLNGCPGRLQLNPNELCLGSPGGTVDSRYGLGASTSSAGLQTANLSDFANTYGEASASSYADLATGKLGASVQVDYYRSGLAVAIFNERLTFNIAGASASTVTPISIIFSIDGQLANSANSLSGASVLGDLRFGSAYANVNYSLANGDPTIGGSLTQGGWVSGSWAAGSNPGQSTFTGVYALSGASDVIAVRSALTAYASSVASSDYFNTSAFQLVLPSNVAYSSESGVFLSAVPEPSSWALMLAGLGSVLTLSRRRKS